jgi:hypothetical protein
MGNKSGGKKYLVSDKSKPWYIHPTFGLAVMLGSLFIWFGSALYITSQLNIKPKLLILRSEGCAYLQLHNIQTKPYPIEHTCSAEVPLTENGPIYASDEIQLVVHDSQIVAVEPLPDRPWTPRQHRLAIYLAVGSAVLIGIMATTLILF